MAKKTTIFIDNDGNVEGLADSVFDALSELGPKNVRRISDIEFDEREQLWVAEDADTGEEIGRHTVRDKLIDIEREVLNERIKSKFLSTT